MNALNVYGDGRVSSRHSISQGYDMRAMHIHDSYEIYMALSEGVRFFVNDRVYALNRGDVMLFTNTDLHKVSVPPGAPYERYVVLFEPGMLRNLPGDGPQLLGCFDGMGVHCSHKLSLTPDEQALFIAAADGIENQRAAALAELGRWLELSRMLLLLCRVRMRELDSPPGIERSKHPGIRAVIALIDADYARDISLDELSACCYLNKHYLCRLFKRETGFCIHDYIVYRRLSCAMARLRTGESVSSAARLSGFRSDTFFITTFKRNIGETPYQYALAHRRDINE